MNIQKPSDQNFKLNILESKDKTVESEVRKGSETQTAKGDCGPNPFGNPSDVYVESKISANALDDSKKSASQDESKNNSSREDWIKMFGKSDVRFGL